MHMLPAVPVHLPRARTSGGGRSRSGGHNNFDAIRSQKKHEDGVVVAHSCARECYESLIWRLSDRQLSSNSGFTREISDVRTDGPEE